MRTYARFCVPALFAVGLDAVVQNRQEGRIHWLNLPPYEDWNVPEAPQPPSPIGKAANDHDAALPTTPPPHFVGSPAHSPVVPGAQLPGPYTNTTPVISSTPVPTTTITYTPPAPLTRFPHIVPTNLNSSSTRNGSCTGCNLAAYHPVTTWFDPSELSNPWTSTVVTETIVTEYITYMNNNTIDTIVTEHHTLNQTKTVSGPDNQPITHTTPTFSVLVTDGVYLQFDAGPTYVIYKNLYGGVDEYIDRVWPQYNWTQKGCMPRETRLEGWQPAQTALQDWNYFVATHTGSPSNTANGNQVFPLPTQIVDYLELEPAIQSQFHGLDLASCSLRKPPLNKPSLNGSLELSMGPPAAPKPTLPAQFPPLFSPTTGTFLSTTYESTSVHNTVRGCLRCLPDFGQPAPTPVGKPGVLNVPPLPNVPNEPNRPTGDTDNSPNTPGPIQTQPVPAQNQPVPAQNQPGPAQNKPGSVQNELGKPGHQDQDKPNLLPPVVVIEGHTLKPGQTQTVDGVPVVVIGGQTVNLGQTNAIDGAPAVYPTYNGGPRIVVDDSTITYDAVATPGPPVITIGGGTVIANPQGEFVFGTETLKPGGPPVIVNGNTVSLGSNGIAVVNGVTQTITGAPAPPATAAPAPVVGDRTMFTTLVGGLTVYVVAPGQAVDAGSWAVIDGTTAYIPAPGQTITPGGTLTISGTTYGLPEGAPGGVVVINGVTSTMTPGAVVTPAPALTINDITYTQTVRDGTAEYVLGNGTTLAPGSTVEMDGTTYSLDESGTALVINGHTSTLPKLPKSTSASVTSSSMASTSSGAASTTSRNAGDLIASGVGETSKGVGASIQTVGIDKWVENLIIGAVGWLVMLL